MDILKKIFKWLKLIVKKLFRFSKEYVIPIILFLNELKNLLETATDETGIENLVRKKIIEIETKLNNLIVLIQLQTDKPKLKILTDKKSTLIDEIKKLGVDLEKEKDAKKKSNIKNKIKTRQKNLDKIPEQLEKLEKEYTPEILKDLEQQEKDLSQELENLETGKVADELLEEIQDEIYKNYDIKKNFANALSITEEQIEKYFTAFVESIMLLTPDLKGSTYLETVKNFIEFLKTLNKKQIAMYLFRIGSNMILETLPKNKMMRSHEADFLLQSYYTYNKKLELKGKKAF